MNFNSFGFLIFLPVVVMMYWILPHKFRWILLLVASYYFYMSWNAYLILLIMATTVTAYVAAIAIEETKRNSVKRLWFVLTLVICLGLLVFFKYINFILESVVGVIRIFYAEQESLALEILLPVGISFYTFQTLSYVIDVYRGNYRAERHFGYFALYVSYFPQLVAGPIEKPQTLLPQLHHEQVLKEEDFTIGFKYLLSGFFRKCVVADFCGIFVDNVYRNLASANGLAVLTASALFLIQIYNDFAGYSEIALGSARLMGVKLSKNFNQPLRSVSYTEFFRRWHITLNQWFTEYVYIPLGGNRKGTARKILNTLIVFSLCGLWHGANWTFVLWGLVAGIVISIETLLRKPVAAFCQKHQIDLENASVKLVRQIFIFLLFTFSCILFRAQSIAEVGIAFRQIFSAWGFGESYVSQTMTSLGMNTLQLIQLVVVLFAMGMLYRFTEEPVSQKILKVGQEMQISAVYIYGIAAIGLFWLALIANSDVSGFMYFQF